MQGATPERTEGETVWQLLECGAYTADLPLWRALLAEVSAKRDPCRVLELGCGVGRVSLDLAGESCKVTALDIDHELVDALRKSARAADVPIEALEGDVRSFALDRRFDLVIAPMQLVQLLSSTRDRLSMFRRVARHLKPSGLAAFALLDPDEQWETAEDQAPLADVCEIDDRVYSSRPMAVRVIDGGRAIELDRLRRVLSSSGHSSESLSRVRLELLTPAELRAEAARSGLRQRDVRHVPATDTHMGSTVIVFEPDA